MKTIFNGVLEKKLQHHRSTCKTRYFVRNAFVNKEHVVSVFFDLEKAYDTTWKYGILKVLQNIGLRDHLPNFIKKFFKQQKF